MSTEQKIERVKKMANKCLLLKTPDSRCFFTEEANYPLLVEFGRTFDAEISVVQTRDQVEVLEMEDLAKSICSQPAAESPLYEVMETKLAAPIKKTLATRAEKLRQAGDINDFIRQQMLNGKAVSLGDLESKFSNISKSALSNHLTRARRELQARGHYIVKDKPGQYRVAPEQKPDNN